MGQLLMRVTPQQAVHTLTATATKSGWALVGEEDNQKTWGKRSQQREAQEKLGVGGVHADAQRPRAPAERPEGPTRGTHLYLLSSIGRVFGGDSNLA